MNPADRLARLTDLLAGGRPLWRPQPFKETTPAWCEAWPALAAELLALDDATVAAETQDDPALIRRLARHLPELAELDALIRLPALTPATPPPHDADTERLLRHVPGRKQQQIIAYAQALDSLGHPTAPLLEWCAGKGHLGRLLAARHGLPVHSLEIDARLCAEGTELARSATPPAKQHFIVADALDVSSEHHLAGRHAIALHACGDLHRALLEGATRQTVPALDLAPCCHHLTRHAQHPAYTRHDLGLDRDDLRLAVTNTATAAPRERRHAQRALAWKLGWVEWRAHIHGEAYQPFPPIPQDWLRGDFPSFMTRVCARHDLPAPPRFDEWETRGRQRAARMARLQLARLAFRRPLEIWLLLDMAVHLERHGYHTRLGTFCPPQVTPRNLLLSARRDWQPD